MKSPLSTLAGLLIVLGIVAGFRLASSQAAEPKEAPLAERLIGTWVLVGTPDNVGDVPESGGRLKFYTGKCWCITEADPETGKVRFHHGGTYELDGSKMTSKVAYAGESTEFRLNTTSHFDIKVDGDTYTQVGLDNPYTEVWKRVK